MAHICRTTFYLQENLLQLATMVEKIECCESSHSQLEQHTHQLRQQLEAQQAAHMQQNSELRAVLQDSQAGLKHLVRDKVCSCGQDIFTNGLASSLLFACSHASHLRHNQKQSILNVAVHWTTVAQEELTQRCCEQEEALQCAGKSAAESEAKCTQLQEQLDTTHRNAEQLVWPCDLLGPRRLPKSNSGA